MDTKVKEEVPQKQANMEMEENTTSGHTCAVCGRSFPLLSSLSQHMRRHTREKPYECPYCEHRTAQKGSLKAHIRSHKLGLLTCNLSDKEGKGDQGEKNEVESPAPLNIVSTTQKAHKVNGKMKKEGAKKKVKSKGGSNGLQRVDDGPFTCCICGEMFPQVLLLKTHVKKHSGPQDHGCRICGRRFRQAWSLQSHMRIHRIKGQLRGSKGNDSPPTINGVPQDPASLTNEECLYELCAGCGNFFFDRESLKAHERLHRPNPRSAQTESPPNKNQKASKLHFLESLNLKCVEQKAAPAEKCLGKRIPELDPVCSYQAWQLATRGRLVAPSDKCLGWEETLAEAEVAYDTEKGEYVPLKRDKKKKQMDTSSQSAKKKKKNADPGLDHKESDKKICQKDRILLNGLGHAFYEAMHAKRLKNSQGSMKQNKISENQDLEDNEAYFCEHCDFHTVDASLLRSHVHMQHQDSVGAQSNIKTTSKTSRYTDYLRSRSLLLSQPYWNPYSCPPNKELLEANVKLEKSNGAEDKGQEQGDVDCLLNLSSLQTAEDTRSVHHSGKTEGLMKHQCSYCSHTSTYPEVLWTHQRVSHRVDCHRSMIPKWAPCTNSLKNFKGDISQWRRTGPPPFLEGKDCPASHTPRTQRTQAPDSSSQSSSKHSAHKTQSGNQKSEPPLKDSRSSDGSHSGGKAGVPSRRKSAEHSRPSARGGRKDCSAQATSSHSITHRKSVTSVPPASSPKNRDSNRAALEGNFPQEGLGFMLARNNGGTTSNSADRLHSRRQSNDFTSSLKGPDLWAAMNMWGLQGSNAYLDALAFAQRKSEAGETPMDIDILSVLKNYSPHELAALYQHWGFIDPRLDPQALFQFNGGLANGVHSASEASKQMNSHATSSSGSLHKGT
ncbi:zinc finger protein 516-like [Gouania willdenowi]|uniref:Zinc finger protein 516-like n=1 Tax=Gouania willdenowi TaxID=441366 RepID=A0A8C5EIL1_GOUWI|nr:zinc finger protein 516-like [Gouania willdenowi]